MINFHFRACHLNFSKQNNGLSPVEVEPWLCPSAAARPALQHHKDLTSNETYLVAAR